MAKAQIEWTKEFERFQTLGFNRDLDDKRVARLAESIRTYGFLLPIVVNQSFYVVDGQHRLAAAKILNHEISYFQYDMDDDKLPLLVADLNTTAKTWSIENYMHMWSQLGRPVYVWLKETMEKDRVPFHHFWIIIGASTGEFPTFNRKFKIGTIDFTETQKKKIGERIGFYRQIIGAEKRFADFGFGFASAVARLITRRGYDHQRMMMVLAQEPGSLLRARTTPEYARQLEDMYNRGLTEKKRLSHRAA